METTASGVQGRPQARRRRWGWIGLAAVLSVVASGALGTKAADWQMHAHGATAVAKSWHGTVAKVARAGADRSGGLTARLPGGSEVPLAAGDEVKPGWHIVTDERTRARVALDDGTVIVLDRATDLLLDVAPRSATLEGGSLVAEVEHAEGAPRVRFAAPVGAVEMVGTKIALTATADRTSVDVLRGVVAVTDDTGDRTEVSAGQEALLARGARADVAPAGDLAARAAFEGELEVARARRDDADASVSGLGELRAKKPGSTTEADRAVRLSSHAAKIRIVGNVARTEVDEVFTNDTDDVLEGIYRFSLPPRAQIERLALEVDGRLVEGEFVDKAKASAIWRGAIQNAAPKAPKPREEIIWVPGPWRDPALLEWQRGSRFELRIFPIPKRGSRRVVLAYTETVAPVGGVRRYTYPLPQSTASDLTIDTFSIDAQVIGADPGEPVRLRGYEVPRAEGEGANDDRRAAAPRTERFARKMSRFVPSGDLTIEFGLADRRTDASVFAYADAAGRGGEDGFVEIALRPKLPKWQDVKPRDQVIVVDAGRAMFGERFKRARRLALQIAQEMDRRDRVTVLACDVTCRALPGGWLAPGAGAAHDIDAFLAGTSPDGASDLVGAVRAASAIGRDSSRDLRIVMLSSGVASAGYRRRERVAAEVAAALPDARAEIVAVPIGQDADLATLEEVARGGGGVVVPYEPGERLEAASLDVLAATYGTTLRDVEIVLPEGLHDAAPRVPTPLRAGEERLVLARARGDVRGDVVVKGKVGGEPFEAKYPVEVRMTSDSANAFVPRLYAAARIADRERTVLEGDACRGLGCAGDERERSRAEVVALSRRHAVPSRFTSLLVLESEAMFRAFGIERADRGPTWTGEAPATGSDVATQSQADEERDTLGDPLHSAMGGGGASTGAAGLAARPAPAPAAHKAAEAPRAAPLASDDAMDQPEAPRASPSAVAPMPRRLASPPPPRPGRFMKRVWSRRARISSDAPPALADKIAAARAALASAPDARDRHKELARLLAQSGELDALGDVLAAWTTRDPMDGDATAARADLLARQGDRDGALRVLGGVLASTALSASDAATLATALAGAHERADTDRTHRDAACAFRIAAAELRPDDAEAVARAARCERERHADAYERWLGQRDGAAPAAVRTALAKIDDSAGKGEAAVTGDIVARAEWDGGADVDLDVSIVDPSGTRAAWAGRSARTRVTGPTSTTGEVLALSSSATGPFAVELVRGGGSDRAVSGAVTLRALGATQRIPFTLARGASRVHVGRIDVRMESDLVPVSGPISDDAVVTGAPPFDPATAQRVLDAFARSARSCSSENGPVGPGRAQVTFAPTGIVTRVTLDAVFTGTPTGRCVADRFRAARLAPFSGGSVTVSKSFTVDDY